MKKFIVAVAALAMMAGSAYAADWNFYGSARVSTFWSDTDTIDQTDNTSTVIAQALQSNARIGARVKVSDELAGRFEYGAADGNANIRLLYGTWNFGAGTLRVGQDYTPLYLPGSNQVYAVDNGLGGWGEVYGGRKAQIKLAFGGFELAFVAPNKNHTTTAVGTGGVYTQAVATDGEVQLPQIQAAYTFTGSNWDVTIAGGYQTFDVNVNTAGEDDVTSYVLAATANMAVGQFKFGASVHGGQNSGNLISVDVNGGESAADDANNGLALATATAVTDNDTFGWRVYVGYTVNDMFGLEIGYGQNETEYDTAGSNADEVSAYYLQAPITLAPGVFVIPEIGVTDYEESGQDEVTYFGAKWQINF